MEQQGLFDAVADKYVVYADGACKGNPGKGGWGAIVENKLTGEEQEICGGEKVTTNNRMEITAVLEALKRIPKKAEVTVFTDSQYVVKGVTEWMAGWKRRGWQSAGGDPVKNQELWQALDKLLANYKVKWQWVRGHNGHAGNERADALANQGVATLK